ncbi:MAG: protein kinase, partial [Singulisphaera sp.]|nr:protein kinase [Singulisphaera sp.]
MADPLRHPKPSRSTRTAPAGTGRPALDALLEDQRSRFRRGEPVRVEDYLADHPGLEADTEAILDLIYNEIVLREQHGEVPRFDDFRRRFPELAGPLSDLFEVHDAIGPAKEPSSQGATAEIRTTDRPSTEDDTAVMALAPESVGPFASGVQSATAETLLGPSEGGSPPPRPGDGGTPSIPGYEVLELLGRGGMGVVYKARQRSLKRAVVIKMIRGDPHVAAEQLGRFRVEAEAIARLKHPNVVQIYEVGEVGGVPYLSLEMLEGGTLAERLAGAPMPPRQAAALAATLARAVGAVHRVGIVHRDLKPANVLFDADGTPKVADFGLAKRLEVEDGQTVSGQIMGTPSYMAPEQAQGLTRQIGPPADIYALGAILYEMLTGRPPFKGPSIMETLRQIVNEEVVPPSRLQSRLPRDLETICLKCLAKEPARRYATAEELADDLGRFLAGETIRARPTPAWERALKWARRRPARAALVASGLVAAIGLAVVAERHDADTREQARRRDERFAAARLEAVDGIDFSHRQRALDKPGDAKSTLTALLTKLKLQAEPRLADLIRRVEDELRDVQRRLDEDAARAADLERFARFARLRNQLLVLDGNATLFPETLVGAGDQGSSPGALDGNAPALALRRERPLRQIRDIAREAVEVFAADGGDGGLAPGPLPASLSSGQRAEVEADRYLMLLILSEAVARPLSGEDPRHQAAEALRILDQAATLRGPTPAFHLQRAACLERLGDAEAARTERTEAARLKPADAFDHLLLGRERIQRGDWDAARSHFEEALHQRPDSFWAHCLLAIADLNSVPPRAAEAKAELTACLSQQPSFAWLYLLRGSAYGQMGVALAAAARSSPQAAAFAAESEARF